MSDADTIRAARERVEGWVAAGEEAHDAFPAPWRFERGEVWYEGGKWPLCNAEGWFADTHIVNAQPAAMLPLWSWMLDVLDADPTDEDIWRSGGHIYGIVVTRRRTALSLAAAVLHDRHVTEGSDE